MSHYLTKEGLKKIQEELEHLKTVVRKEVVERISSAKELGDLKENAEYSEAKNTQAMTESRILEIEDILRDVQLIDESKHSTDHVNIGSTVHVKVNGKTFTYSIVGPEETNPPQRISFESPIGKALLQKRVGDMVNITTPAGSVSYEIIKVE